MSEKKNSKLEKLHKCLFACKTAFYYSLLFSFIINLMMLAVPVYSLQVLDRVILSASNETLLMLTLVVILALVCLSLVTAVRFFIMIRVSGWLDKSLSPMLFEHGITSSSLRNSFSSSQYLQDLTSIKNFITGMAMNSFLDAPWSLIFISVLFLIHPVIGVVSVFGVLILLTLAVINEIVTKNVIDVEENHKIKSMNYADTASRNAEVIEAMGMLSNINSVWQKENRKSLLLHEKASAYHAVFSCITKFVSLVIQVSIIGVAAYYVIQTQLSIGAMIASGILVGRALAPFENAISSWKDFVTARASLRRLNNSLSSSPIRQQSINLPNPIGTLSFENVYYIPNGQKKPTISGINFKLDSGNILAIIGPSASGKSTMAKLITGVWKSAIGSVRLDGADVYTWPRERFGNHIGYLPQDVELFAGTVKSNIARMDENASDEAVIEAAKKANVHDMILRLSDGYDTQIGTSGMILSAGQRQRIALARAFFGNPRLLILDEPNSNLDNDGDSALLDAIVKAKKNNITVIIISHRVAVLNAVDKILVINDGKISEFDDRDVIVTKLQNYDMSKHIKMVNYEN